MVSDNQLLVNRWLRYLEVKVCPECGHDEYQIRWTGDLMDRGTKDKYWRYRCSGQRCGTVWWDPKKGPSGVTVPKLLNKHESF